MDPSPSESGRQSPIGGGRAYGNVNPYAPINIDDASRSMPPIPTLDPHVVFGGRGSGLTNRTPRVPPWLYLVVAVLFIAVVVLQRPESADPQELAKLKAGDVIHSDSFSVETVLGKLTLVLRGASPPSGRTGGGWPSTIPGTPPTTTAPTPDDPIAMIVDTLDQQAKATEFAQDLFRAAVMMGEFRGLSEMNSRLDVLKPKLSAESKLHQDIATVRALYELAAARREGAAAGVGHAAVTRAMPSEADVKDLIDRHRWVGKLAASAPEAWATQPSVPITVAAPLPNSASPFQTSPSTGAVSSTVSSLSSFRDRSISDGTSLVVVFAIFGFTLVVVLLTGTVLLIVGASLALSGKLAKWNTPWRDEFAEIAPTLRNARVWLETFGLFVGGFLALLFLRGVVPYQQLGIDPLWFVLLSQWLLVLTLFWPVVRGVRWRLFRALVGWHRGRGVMREVGFGIVAYLASIPVYVFFAIIVVVMMLLYEAITGHKAPPPSTDKMVDLASGGAFQLAMVVLLASVWAPLVEETIFRGCVYRFLRGKLGIVAAVGLSALAFALMHGYMIQQLILVGVLGAVFAMMRESRGSLIPSMTAHCVHNTAVFAFLSFIISFGSDV